MAEPSIAVLLKAKRNGAAARWLIASTAGQIVAAKQRAALLPADAGQQREQLLSELSRCLQVLHAAAKIVANVGDQDPVPDSLLPLFLLTPGLKDATGRQIFTPIPLWPSHALAAIEALEGHAQDMRGAFWEALQEQAALLPETIAQGAQDLVELGSSWTAPILIGVGTLGAVAVLIAVSRRSRRA